MQELKETTVYFIIIKFWRRFILFLITRISCLSHQISLYLMFHNGSQVLFELASLYNKTVPEVIVCALIE